MQQNRGKISILLLGPPKSGKSSIVDTLLNQFEYREKEYYPSAGTLGINVNLRLPHLGIQTFSIVDIAGYQFNLRKEMAVVNRLKEETNYIVIAFNRTDREQYNQVKEYLSSYSHKLYNKIVYLIGTFNDVPKELLQVTEEEGKALAREYTLQYLSVTSKVRTDLERLTESIAKCEAIRSRLMSSDFINNQIRLVQSKYRSEKAAILQLRALQANPYKWSIRKREIFQQIVALTLQEKKKKDEIYDYTFDKKPFAYLDFLFPAV